MGDAVQTFPPTLDTLRTCGPANHRSCSLMATSPLVRTGPSVSVSVSHVLSSVVSVTLAPNTRLSSATVTSVSSGTCVGATMTGYFMFLNLTSTPTSVLPHTSLASGWAFLSASSPARVVGLCHVAIAPGNASGLWTLRLSSGGKMGSRTAVTGSSSAAPRALAAGVFPQPFVHGCPVEGQMGVPVEDLPLRWASDPLRCEPWPSPLRCEPWPSPLVTPLADPLMVSPEYAESGAFLANVLNPSRMGLYPVHLHRLPPRASSISSSVGLVFLDLSSAYMLMTKPGVQKPHWEPCACARALCTG